MKNNEKIFKHQSIKGITLIALVVTIVILLILASVSINLTVSNNGILFHAVKAKKDSVVADEKSNIQLGAGAAYMKGNGEITNDRSNVGNYDGNLDIELSKLLGQESTATEIGDWNIVGNGPWTITIEETNHIYTLEKDGTISESVAIEETTDTDPGILKGDGTKSNPFLIESIEDLVAFENNINTGTTLYENQYVQLGISLDFQYTKSYALESSLLAGGLRDQLTDGEGFVTIGNYSYYTFEKTEDGYNVTDRIAPYAFKGTFDGNGKELINLYVNRESTATQSEISENVTLIELHNRYQSLFGTNYGNIENLVVRKAHLIGDYYISGIAGSNNGKILNCKVCQPDFSKKCYGYISGISVTNLGTIEECTFEDKLELIYNAGEPDCAASVAGIAAQNGTMGIINKCCNKAEIILDVDQSIPNYSECAGIIAINSGTITNSCNIGNITQKGVRSYTSGICGRNYNSINRCYNSGTIIANGSYCPRVGAIAGVAEDSSIIDCYNTGDVTIVEISKYTKVAGIVGENRTKSDITNCYNTGKISGVGTHYVYIGAITAACANNVPTITNCYYLDTSHPNLYGTTKPVVVNSTSKTMDLMKSTTASDFLDLINGNNSFKLDTNNINNGYPILSWQE